MTTIKIEGWYRISIDRLIATIESGARPKGGASTESGTVPSLGGENLTLSGELKLNILKLVPVDFYERMSKGHLEHGDVLINKDGAQTGKVGFFEKNISPACINEHLFLLRGCKDCINQKYLYYILLSETGQKQIHSQISGSAQPGLKADFIKGVTVDLPYSLTAQSKIAHILSTVDQSIEQTEALIAKQQRIKAGLMQDLLTRGIDEQGDLRSEKTHQFKDSPLGRIPVEWGVGGLDSYVVNDAGIKPGPFGSSLTKDMYVQSGYRVFGQEQVIGGSFDIGDYFVSKKKFIELANFAVRAGDVLISLVGTIGHVLIVPKDHHPGLINPRLLRFRPDHKYCLPEFLRYLILSHPTRHQLDALATGGTMAVISAGIVKKLCTVIVGISEQSRNIQMLEKSEICILESFKALKKLHSLKTALMQDLLTGRKRVTSLLSKEEMAKV